MKPLTSSYAAQERALKARVGGKCNLNQHASETYALGGSHE